MPLFLALNFLKVAAVERWHPHAVLLFNSRQKSKCEGQFQQEAKMERSGLSSVTGTAAFNTRTAAS